MRFQRQAGECSYDSAMHNLEGSRASQSHHVHAARTESDWLMSESMLRGLGLGLREIKNEASIGKITTNYLPILLAQASKQVYMTDRTV